MTCEAGDGAFAEQASTMLTRAEKMLAAGLPEDAARTAYLSNFHIAQALIYEKTERIAKIDHGVQTEFARLTRNDPNVDGEVRATLSRSYDFKSFADYFSGPITSVTPEEASQAIADAKRFVTLFITLLDTPDAAT